MQHDAQAQGMSDQDVYFIETFLRQRGDHETLLAIDALILDESLSDAERATRLETTIQGVINGKQ